MKPVVGIFAHPDDEVFGPGGTLATFAKEGRDVYVICVTNGEAGQNVSKKTNPLKDIRQEEVLESAKVLGIKKVFFFDFKDGDLSNNLYHEIAEKVENLLEEIKPEIILTLEPRGVSGHIDHIVVSLVSTYVFNKLSFIKELWYFCFTEEGKRVLIKYLGDYFVYFPAGYKKSEISKTVDVSSVWEQKIAAMNKHESQLSDVTAHLNAFTELPKEENYIVLTKDTE